MSCMRSPRALSTSTVSSAFCGRAYLRTRGQAMRESPGWTPADSFCPDCSPGPPGSTQPSSADRQPGLRTQGGGTCTITGALAARLSRLLARLFAVPRPRPWYPPASAPVRLIRVAARDSARRWLTALPERLGASRAKQERSVLDATGLGLGSAPFRPLRSGLQEGDYGSSRRRGWSQCYKGDHESRADLDRLGDSMARRS